MTWRLRLGGLDRHDVQQQREEGGDQNQNPHSP
jgi:hypothetical protein